jgi:glycosyltransferase involved in cell wall biosynthesis
VGVVRVALLSYRSDPCSGGQGVYVRNLSRELVALGHQVEVFSGPPYPELDDGVVLTPVLSMDLYRQPDPFRRPHWSGFRDLIDVLEYAIMARGGFPEPLTFSLRAARLMRQRAHEFDVIHDNQTLGYGLLSIQRMGPPLVTTIHHPITVDRRIDLAAATSADQRRSLRRWYGFLPMQRRVARAMRHIITVSRTSAADIVRDFRVPPQRLRVIPVGVDPAVFHPVSRPRVPGRIVTVANPDAPIKGVPVLLEAIAKLGTTRDVRLIVVTKTPPSETTVRRVEALGLAEAVRFAHGLDHAEVATLLASAEVAVVPSLYEGFSLPAVEAMACGTPLVASRTGALPEVVGDDGAAGLLVAPGNADALAAAVDRLLGDPSRRTHMAAAGRGRVAKRFTWRIVAEQTAAFYAKTADRRKAAPNRGETREPRPHASATD